MNDAGKAEDFYTDMSSMPHWRKEAIEKLGRISRVCLSGRQVRLLDSYTDTNKEKALPGERAH